MNVKLILLTMLVMSGVLSPPIATVVTPLNHINPVSPHASGVKG